MEEQRPWHRLFGLSWKDLLRDAPVTVEMEIDLSIKLQLLDVVIVRKGTDALPRRLPDGFEDLRPHNLISFKSYQEALDGWALDELVGHFVNYRKQASPTMQNLLPLEDFARFAVTVRYPRDLAHDLPLKEVGQGVYEARHFSGPLRIIVVHQLPKEVQNSMLLCFSAKPDVVQYGVKHYLPRSREWSTLLLHFWDRYRKEGIAMPYTMEEFMKESIPNILKELPVEKRLEGLSPEERLEGLSPEERVKGLSLEMLTALIERMKEKESAPKQE